MMAGMDNVLAPTPGRSARQVYCLCAEWCGVCREWRAAFNAQAAAHAADRFEWIDVDAHEEVLDAVEIEAFPVMLIAEQGRVLFFGAIEPSGGILARLLDRVEHPAAPATAQAQQVLDFVTTLA
jgi:thioredoxin 1